MTQNPQENHPPPSLAPTPCPRCGAIDTPTLSAGTGPHAFRASCAHCGAFLRWVSRYGHEDRVRRREQWRREALRRLAPTVNQMAYLTALKYAGPAPGDRAEASRLIEQLTS